MNKVYKTILPLIALLFAMRVSAQEQVAPTPPKPPKNAWSDREIEIRSKAIKDAQVELKKADLKLKEFDVKLKNINIDQAKLAAISPKINRVLNDFKININADFEADAKNSISVEKVKNYNKVYDVSSKDRLSINNQYGRVQVNVWNRNSIEVKVEIKAYEATDDRANELLDGVSISDSKQGDLISFKTNIERGSNTSWWGIKKSKDGVVERRGVEVNYTINMPSKNALEISNKYGTTILPDFEGPVAINSSYGSFKAEKLDNPANKVTVKYGSANIKTYSSGNLTVSYGGLTLTNGNNLDADIGYSSAKISRLTNSANLSVKYGSLRVEEVDKSVKNLMVNSSYGGVTLGVDQNANVGFDVTVSYGGFNYGASRLTINSRTPEDTRGFNPTKNYKGQIGNGENGNYVIKVNYASVKFQ